MIRYMREKIKQECRIIRILNTRWIFLRVYFWRVESIVRCFARGLSRVFQVELKVGKIKTGFLAARDNAVHRASTSVFGRSHLRNKKYSSRWNTQYTSVPPSRSTLCEYFLSLIPISLLRYSCQQAGTRLHCPTRTFDKMFIGKCRFNFAREQRPLRSINSIEISISNFASWTNNLQSSLRGAPRRWKYIETKRSMRRNHDVKWHLRFSWGTTAFFMKI